MTLNDIRRRVLENLQDLDESTGNPQTYSGSGPGFFDLIDRAINDSLREIEVLAERVDPTVLNLRRTGIDIEAVGGASVPDIRETFLPNDFRRVVSLNRTDVSPGRTVQIVPLPRFQFYVNVDVGDYAFLRNTYAPRNTLTPIQSDDVTQKRIQRTMLGVSNNVVGTATYELFYASRGVDLVSPSDIPPIQDEFHHLIATSATVRLLMQENSPDVDSWKQRFDQSMSLMAKALPKREGGDPAAWI